MLKIYILESKIDPFNQQSIDSHMHNVCCHTDIDKRLENTLQQKRKDERVEIPRRINFNSTTHYICSKESVS